MEINYEKDAWYRRSATMHHRSWLLNYGSEMLTIIKEEWARPRKRVDGWGSEVSKTVYCVYKGNVTNPSFKNPLAIFTTYKEANYFANIYHA